MAHDLAWRDEPEKSRAFKALAYYLQYDVGYNKIAKILDFGSQPSVRTAMLKYIRLEYGAPDKEIAGLLLSMFQRQRKKLEIEGDIATAHAEHRALMRKRMIDIGTAYYLHRQSTCKEIGDQVGLSAARIQQIICKFERFLAARVSDVMSGRDLSHIFRQAKRRDLSSLPPEYFDESPWMGVHRLSTWNMEKEK